MLSHRRRSLLTLASYGTWDFDTTSFPYVYNSLLPNGSEVVKGKIAKIYANGVIENQLISDNFESTSYWAKNRLTQTCANNVATFTINSNAYAFAGFYHNFVTGSLNKGHKYLAYCYIKKVSGNANKFQMYWHTVNVANINSPTTNTWYFLGGIITQTRENTENTNGFDVSMRYASTSDIVVDSDSFEVKVPQLIDLTRKYGAGNEPTTITDNRIQNLLNRGYIAYNQGEYKGTNIGEIATEPYNLFDANWTRGNIASSSGYIDNTGGNIRSDNFVSIKPNTIYTIEYDRTSCNTAVNGYCYLYSYQYDENKNYLGVETTIGSNSTYDLTTLPNAYYILFKIYSNGNPAYSSLTSDTIKMCIHLQGTRTGYSKHKPSASIPFIYQGNGNETNHDSLEITKTEFVFTKEVNYVDSATMPTTLATPQVIRIPRKHLGIVDLGTLIWTYNSFRNCFVSNVVSNISTTTPLTNFYCYKYEQAFGGFGSKDMIISINNAFYGSSKEVNIRDTQYGTNATDFSNAMQGTYLFYETAEEVDDIATRIFTENGGSVTTDSEVLPNLDLDLPVRV